MLSCNENKPNVLCFGMTFCKTDIYNSKLLEIVNLITKKILHEFAVQVCYDKIYI